MNWETISEFHIYQSMQTIRSTQFQKGKMVHLQLQPHRVFLKGMPSMAMDETQIAVSKKDLTGDQRHLRSNCVYAYIRQASSKHGIKEEPPAEGSHIKLDWDNSTPHSQHVLSEPYKKWQGNVISVHRSELLATGADFCAFLTKPGKVDSNIKQYPDLRKLRDNDLLSAYIEVIHDDGPAVSELVAVREFSDMSAPNPALDPFRQAFVSKPTTRPADVDLSLGIPPRKDHQAAYGG